MNWIFVNKSATDLEVYVATGVPKEMKQRQSCQNDKFSPTSNM